MHGCIDGYSRMITYLHCLSNNRSETVLTLFKEATQQLSLPSRVRCDMGVENRAVSMYMLSHPIRGPNRNSVLVGRSVHNQTIERLWRDVYSGVLSLFYDLFMHMEDEGVLDPMKEVHLYSLHFTFIPRINRVLDQWTRAWNMHGMRSERGYSPMQLWTTGLQAHFGSDAAHSAPPFLFEKDVRDTIHYVYQRVSIDSLYVGMTQTRIPYIIL